MDGEEIGQLTGAQIEKLRVEERKSKVELLRRTLGLRAWSEKKGLVILGI